MKKFLSIILVILAISSFFLGLFTIVHFSEAHPTSSAMEGLYYTIHYSWIAWLFMLIPIGCLIFGILMKQTKNIITGVAFSLFLFMLGCFYLIGFLHYSTDIAYLEKIEADLEITLPNEGTIITEDWTSGKQTSSDNNYYKYNSVARFSNAVEVNTFISHLDQTKWRTEKESIADLIPITSDLQTNDCEYFLLYCYETKKYDVSSSSMMPVLQEYNYVYMALDIDQSVLYVTEFTKK